MATKELDFIQIDFYRNFWTFQVAEQKYVVYSRDEYNAKRDLISYLSIIGIACKFEDIKIVKL